MDNKPWSLLPNSDIAPRVPNHCEGLHIGSSCEGHDLPFVYCPHESTGQQRSEPFSDFDGTVSLGEFSNCSYAHALKPGCQISFDTDSINSDLVRSSDDAQRNKPPACTKMQVLPHLSQDPSDLGQKSLATCDCKMSRSDQRFSLTLDIGSFFDCDSTDGRYNLVLPQTMSPNPMKTSYRNLQRTKFRPFRVSHQQLLNEADITDRCVPLNPHTLCEATHGSIKIEDEMTFPVRHGYNFELALSSLDTERDDTASLLQLVFVVVQKQIRQLDKIVHNAITAMPPSQAQPPEQDRPIEMAISPPLRAGNPVNSFDALNFLTTLQCYWQPLSVVAPVNADPFVPVMTWFVDHIRFPQWFLPRPVQLFADPEEWIHILRSAWRDVIRADVVLHFALVQPHPIALEPGVAAHIILTQQPIEDFRSVLISTVDSLGLGNRPQDMQPWHPECYHTPPSLHLHTETETAICRKMPAVFGLEILKLLRMK